MLALTPQSTADGNAESLEGLVPKVIRGIRELIQTEALRIGDRLPSEKEVAEQLAVSRTVVREAYRSMSALELISVGNGRTPRVAAPSHEVLATVIDHGVKVEQVTVQQVLDVRRTIEMRTVALAALNRTGKEARHIRAHASGMRSGIVDAARVMRHDIAFHEAIAHASRNPMFGLVVGSFHVVTRQTWHAGWDVRSRREREKNVALHEAIARAIEDKDRDRAVCLMADHFDDTVKLLLDSGLN